jgi:hypothetical protein
MRSTVQCLGCLLAIGSILAAGAAWAQLSISRFTIDSGGGTRSLGGSFALGGTIGQPDGGLHSGASFTVGSGFWGLGGATATGVEIQASGDGIASGATPLAFQLYPPRPNPVAERTLVAFDLPAPSRVHAALYDVSGRLVRRLVDVPLTAGKHQFAWDRRNQSGRLVPSGIYFLQLEAGAHVSRQKIVVIS